MALSNRSIIYLIHILFVAPLLIYIGYKGTNTQDAVFKLLIIIGLVVILYHSYMLYKTMSL